MNRTERSFTLLELILVVILIGVMAGYGVPSYQRAIEKNEERVAIVKLQTIVAGMKIYQAKHGDYPAVDMPDLTSINQTLGLNIVADNMSYDCDPNDLTDPDVCKARHPSDWRIHWHPGDSGAGTIHCSNQGPACPSCPFWDVVPYSCG